PRLPPDKVATIKPTRFSANVSIVVLDGASVDATSTSVSSTSLEVLPGPHTIGVWYASGGGGFVKRSIRPCYITFQAEPGHTYYAHGLSFGLDWSCWLEDSQGGRRVTSAPHAGPTSDTPGNPGQSGQSNCCVTHTLPCGACPP